MRDNYVEQGVNQMKEFGMAIVAAGLGFFAFAVVWALRIAGGESEVWFWRLFRLFPVAYPFFVYEYWNICKKNVIVMCIGIALFFIGAVILDASQSTLSW